MSVCDHSTSRCGVARPQLSDRLLAALEFPTGSDPQLAAIGVAIALEDTLGIVVPDACLTPNHLGSAVEVRRLLERLAV